MKYFYEISIVLSLRGAATLCI